MGIGHNVSRERDRAARRRRRRRARDARSARRELQRRDARHGRLPHGVLRRSRRQRADAPPPLRAASHGGLSVRARGSAGERPAPRRPRAARAPRARAAAARRSLRRVLRRARAERGRPRADPGGEPLDQDAVALAAGSIVSLARASAGTLSRPGRPGAATTGWRSRRSTTPTSPARPRPAWWRRSASSRRARSRRSPTRDHGRRRRCAGSSTPPPSCEHPVTLIANLATHHLWGGRPTAAQLLELPLRRRRSTARRPTGTSGTSPASSRAPRGRAARLYAVADTYPSLGDHGVHLQPEERLAAAIARPDKPAGGVIAVVSGEDAAALRGGGRGARAARSALGQRHDRRAGRVSAAELVSLVVCDLGAIVRGTRGPRLRARGAARQRASAGCPPTTRSRRSGRWPNPTRSARPATCACCPTRRRACGSAPRRARARSSCCCATSSRLDGRAVGLLPAEPSSTRALGELQERAGAARRRASSTSSSCCADERGGAAVLARGPARGGAVRERADGGARRGRRRAGALLPRVRQPRSSRSRSPPPPAAQAADRAVVTARGRARGRPPRGDARDLRAAARPRRGGQRRARPHQPSRRGRAAAAPRLRAPGAPERARRELRGGGPRARSAR